MVIYNEKDIDEILFEMKNNKAVIVPTDTQIGIAAIDKAIIYKIKRRSYTKKIILFVNGVKEVHNPSENFVKLANKFWPGKLTLIESGISYRMPDSKVCLELLEGLGRYYCSSANISGKEPITNVSDAATVFAKNQESIVVVNAPLGNGVASTIYDVDKHKIIRLGDISEEDINECLQTKVNNR